VLSYGDPSLWSYPGHESPEDLPSARCALSVIRSNLVLQVLGQDAEAFSVDWLETYVRVAERDYINLQDTFDQNVGEALAVPIAGIPGAIVHRRPFSDMDSGSQFQTTSISGSAASVVSRGASFGRPTQHGMERDDAEWWNAVRADAAAALSGGNPALHLSPGHGAAWVKVRDIWRKRGRDWDFWIGWNEATIEGKTLDFGLLKAVANISDGTWSQGPKAVAEEIARIEERLRLLDLVVELKRSLAEATSAAAIGVASPQQRGHNQPPDLIDASMKVRETSTAIRAALDEAETELAKPDPAPSALTRIATTLAATVAVAASYCGDKLDIFITKAVEEGGSAFGKWGVPTLIAYWATPNGTMQMLIKGLFDLASKLSP